MREKVKTDIEAEGSEEHTVRVEETGVGTFGNKIFKAQVKREEPAGPDVKRVPNTRDGGGRRDSGNWNIDLLLDVELPVRVSFGQAEMLLRDVFKLGPGSVIELDKSVNDPVTVIVNNKPIAKGEVVMVDGNYGVRILEVESTADRIRSLG